MTNDINIVGGTIVTSHGSVQEAAVGIRGETISFVGSEKDLLPAKRTVDARGCLVMPGMIDAHVHVRAPSFSYREDFRTATSAAAAGGVTTIVEMPISEPPASDVNTLKERISCAAAHAIADFCFYAGAGDDNLDAIPDLARCGVVGFKTFLMPAPKGREREFRGLCSTDEETLEQVLVKVGMQGRFVAVHAEDSETVNRESSAVQAASIRGITAFSRSRPPQAEIRAVKRVLKKQQRTGTRVLVCHVSTPESIDCIASARIRGFECYAETCPHYLLLSEEKVRSFGPFARVKPPIRSEAIRELLFGQFCQGKIHILSSDHAPYSYKEKEQGITDIWKAPDGIPALELSLLLMLEKAGEGLIDESLIVIKFSENPARLLGIYPRKGALLAGSDADVIIVEPSSLWRVACGSLQTKARECCKVYEGWPLHYRVRSTFCRGSIVFENGEICGKPGHGTFVKPMTHGLQPLLE